MKVGRCPKEDSREHTTPQETVEENFKKRMVNNSFPEREQSEISTKICPLNIATTLTTEDPACRI